MNRTKEILFRFIYIALFVVPFLSFGQGDFRHLSWQDGLSSNKTYQSVEDSIGFIWVSTDEGIDRFDGREFVHYELEMHDEITSLGYLFYRVIIDGTDNIFVISNRGHVFKLNRLLDRFQRLPEFEEYYGRYVFSAFLDSKGNLLLGTPSGLIVFDLAKKTSVDVAFTKPVYAIIEFKGNYLLGINDGLMELSGDFLNTNNLGIWNKQIGHDIRLRSLLYDKRNNRVWFGAQESGLNYFDLKTLEYKRSSLNKGTALHEFPVWDIVMANDSTMLVGTDGAGISVVDLKALYVRNTYATDNDDENSISSNVIHDLLVCRNSMYFIATNMGGVNILNPGKPKFDILKRQITDLNSLRNNVIHAIVELAPGKIAFGTDQGISIWQKDNNSWHNTSDDLDGSKNNVVTSMTKSNDGSLWVGYFIDKTELISPSGVYIKLPEEIEESKNSKAMYFDDKRNTFWMGHEGQSHRLLSYDLNRLTFHSFSIQEVSRIVSHPSGKLLVGTHAGLYIIDKNNNNYHLYGGLNDKLNRVTCLMVDSNEKIWVGSNGGGVAVFDLNLNKPRVYDEVAGLASSKVYAIIEDDAGKKWVTTEVGLSSIDPVTSKIVNYYESDGIASGDFMYNAICKASDGTILLGSTGGVTIFDPKTLTEPSIIRNLVFTGLFINQKKVFVDEGSVLRRPLNYTNAFELKYNQNSFTIEFANIDFIHPEQAKYIWKLDGVDEDWNPKTNVGRAVYSNVKPGKYVFRLRNQSKFDQDDRVDERIINIHIRNPLWKRPMAYLLYGLIIIGIMFFGLYYNKLMHDVRAGKEKLKYIVDMAHEIKTPLSLIRAPIGDLLQENNDTAMVEKLKMAMLNVEKLQKKIGLFLDFKLVNQIATVHFESIEIISFLKKKVFAFKILAERYKIQLNFETPLQELAVYSDPELLDKIIDNLLSNALKYNNPGGYVNLRLQVDDDIFKVIVTDSGIGIPKKEQKNIFKLFFRATTALDSKKVGSGVGLALTRDMVNVLKGNLVFQSKEGNGTTFFLTMPIGKPELVDPQAKPDEKETEELENGAVTIDNRFKVLVVEDDEDMRKYIAQQLLEHYQVIEATNGQDALEIAQNKLPDLVLSDVAMAKMNGRQLCMNIKSQPITSHIPVILLSGLDSKDNVLRGLAAGADDYISKPFDLSILMAKIENLINNRKELKEKFLKSDQWDADINFKNVHDKAFVAQITELVEENISESDFSVRLLFTTVGMSRTAFYHKLKSLIDLSPAEFIRLVRLNHAKELLLSGRYNINEVAYRCGFSDAKYFSTSFKRQFGQSPSSYVSDKIS